MRKRKHKRESFDARIKMERLAQIQAAAKLSLLEMQYKNKTRTR